VRIDLDRIPPDGLVLEGVEPDCELDWDRGIVVQTAGPVRYRLFAQIVTGELLVAGSLCVPVALKCSRCADFFGAEIEEPSYRYNQAVDDATASVDLTADMREAMILAFPSYPLCKAECKGLCPRCGANLNQGMCECRAPDESGRWAVLDTLDKLT